ncbi:hypothetical protein [Lacimicrobium alkaliphilum]|uniref:Uncharacterized protein n=2 Tax=Lacimicrobium alkaliphilum TaxID=1526571 RepID=A0A0U3APL4_9ALTE|nr:hypothetical protein [Lacimicrobium alkaliphilum]ALS99842.1 hypothetical protein AT746_17275 [Lacimicrobium alkaliphilum]GGD70248.1 hypothetical protein GCM10011357_26630 [Lacimicrobium alkaliphilum]
MELQGARTSGMSDASVELRSAKLAKNQQEEEGKQALQLLDSAAGVPKPSSADPALGSTIDTFA